MTRDEILSWLMRGDPAIAFQTARDLSGQHRPDLQARMATHGWGRAFLQARNPDGGWGRYYYGPKWACSHYVLLDLANMEFPPDHPEVGALVARTARNHPAADGGFGVRPGERKSDTCVTGMFLTIASHFRAPPALLTSYVDFLISVQMPDGGFNCQINRSGCTHSSLHSTLSVLEGIGRFQAGEYGYRAADLNRIAAEARRFILLHRFYKSDRTGKVINPAFLRLSNPPRWYYNILRALDYFRATGQPHDPAMHDALDALLAKRRADGTWPRMARIAGARFFDMEPQRGPGRWTTLQALRVLDAYPRA